MNSYFGKKKVVTVLCIWALCLSEVCQVKSQMIGSFGEIGNGQESVIGQAVGDGAPDKSMQISQLTGANTMDTTNIAAVLNNNEALWGAYVLDVTGKAGYNVGNGDSSLPASALIGIPILFTVADGFEKGTIDSDTMATFNFTFQGGRGDLKATQDGASFSVLYLMQEALVYSDNNAMNSLIDYLGLDRINNVCHEYGYSSVDMQRKLMTEYSTQDNYISAEDACLMLNAIYQNNFKVIDRDFLLNYFKIAMADTSNAGMSTAGLDCGTFLNLNGYTDSRYNEIGLFSDGSEVLIVAVFTNNGNGENSMEAVREVALELISEYWD